MSKPTCGVLYLEGLEQFAGETAESFLAWTAGFVSGQAEKVYLGACKAAMFRPSDEHFEMVSQIAESVCRRYGLCMRRGVRGNPKKGGNEIWIYRLENADRIGEWLRHEENSPKWHTLRAALCGIPANEIDFEFHNRAGYNEPCDRK